MTKTLYVTDRELWNLAKYAADIRGISLGKYVESALRKATDHNPTEAELKLDRIREILA